MKEELIKALVKICKKHGELTEDQCRIEISDGYKCYRCIQCKREKDARWKDNNREKHRASANRKRNIDRSHVNAWARQDRKNNPEKYREYEKNYIQKHGIETIRRREVLRIHGLTIEQHDAMIDAQSNLCAICHQPETKKTRSGLISPLSIDHCHTTKIVRGLLCHDCNTGLGKFFDSEDLLNNAIKYLKRK